MHIYLFRLSMKDSIRHWHNLLMEQWIFDTSQRSLVLQPGGVLIAVYMTSLQGSFECSGWLNMSYVMRQRIPDRRRGMGKWTMSKYIGFYVRNAYRSWVRWGAELSWWRLDTEKVRQINRGCTREKDWQSVDNLYSIRAWMGSQWRVLRRGETWSRLWAFRTSLAAEFGLFVVFQDV